MQRPRSTVELWPRRGHDRDSIPAGHVLFPLQYVQISFELRIIATVLIDLDHPDAPAACHRAWPDAEFCDLCDLPLRGHNRLCPRCDHCATHGCANPLDDGEGFDGYCGDCADRRDHLYT